MAQKTNLNISPYYDDFDPNDQFYKVLFKPGFPVQARELSTLQSILQNQIESFGSHMFKDGSMVIPGNIAYDQEYYSMIIEPEHLGIPVSLYLDELKGLTLTSQTTGVSVVIDDYLYPEDSDQIEQLTIFVKYLNSGPDNEALFPDNGENLIVNETFVYGNTSINAGETVLKLIDDESCFTGTAAKLGAGVFFIRGNFVEVPAGKILLEPYEQQGVSYRVGLNIDEQFITAKEDSQLYDNARGFSNFAAPGADRLKITTTLAKKSLTDTNDTNFIELLRIDNGEIKVLNSETEYNLIRDYFAKRTFEESGNYSLDDFKLDVLNSLNDGISGDGVYRAGEFTDNGNIPDDDIMCVKVSSGKAYVQGYDIELDSSTLIDVDKPRDKQIVENALVPYQMGTIFKVNHVSGVPAPNIDQELTVELYNKRTTADNEKQGDKIGEARVYSFSVTDAAYDNDTTEWDLHLFDVQIFTKLELNKVVSNNEVPVSSFVRGVSSGATGYVFTVSGGY